MFENAKLAEQESKEAQEKEDATLTDYENEIGEYISGNRNNQNMENENIEWYLLKEVSSSNEETVYTLDNDDKFSNYKEIVLVTVLSGAHSTLRYCNPCRVSLDIFKTIEIESARDEKDRVISCYISDTQFYLWKSGSASSACKAYLYGIK